MIFIGDERRIVTDQAREEAYQLHLMDPKPTWQHPQLNQTGSFSRGAMSVFCLVLAMPHSMRILVPQPEIKPRATEVKR